MNSIKPEYALVPRDVAKIPHEAWDNAAIAYRMALDKHGFYESCYAGFHAFLRSIGQETVRDDPALNGVLPPPPEAFPK